MRSERAGKKGRKWGCFFPLLILSLRRSHNLIAWNRLSGPGLFPTHKLGDQVCAHIHLLFKFIFCLKKEFIYHMHVIKSVESIKHSHPIRYHYRPLLDLLKHPPPSITQMSKRGSVSVHSNNWSVWPVTIITFRLENTSRETGEEKITGDSLD